MLGSTCISCEEVGFVVRRVLESNGVFPPEAKVWQPGETVFEGWFLVKHTNGIVRLHWQRHHPIQPTELAESRSSDFHDLDKAVSAFIQNEWNNGIDGIPISLSRSSQ